jgi:hypothetical protein
MPLNKAWTNLHSAPLAQIPATMGVYELADEAGDILYIGRAGGREPFGIRGRITHHFSAAEQNAIIGKRARAFRYEVNTMYLSRFTELLTLYREEHGRLPPANEAEPQSIPTLGRFHWQPSSGQWKP